jgi:hypothetical protein
LKQWIPAYAGMTENVTLPNTSPLVPRMLQSRTVPRMLRTCAGVAGYSLLVPPPSMFSQYEGCFSVKTRVHIVETADSRFRGNDRECYTLERPEHFGPMRGRLCPENVTLWNRPENVTGWGRPPCCYTDSEGCVARSVFEAGSCLVARHGYTVFTRRGSA